MYHKKIMELFLNPVSVGEIKKPDGKAEVADEVCGSVVKIYLRVIDQKIEDAKFKAYGGPITFAGCSVAMQILTGLTIEEARQLCFEQIMVELVNIPEEKYSCIKTIVTAIQNAIAYYEKKQKNN